MKRTLQRRKQGPTGTSVGADGGADPIPSGGRPQGAGNTWERHPPSSRRRGDGMHGKIVVPKQGRPWRQPRSARRAKTHCISSDTVKSVRVSKAGRSGRSSVDARISRTLAEQRPRGPKWLFEWPEAWSADNTDCHRHEGTRTTKTMSNHLCLRGMRSCRLSLRTRWEGHRRPMRHFGLKPYWGKPAVRNFREGGGNTAQDGPLAPRLNRHCVSRGQIGRPRGCASPPYPISRQEGNQMI